MRVKKWAPGWRGVGTHHSCERRPPTDTHSTTATKNQAETCARQGNWNVCLHNLTFLPGDSGHPVPLLGSPNSS